jgi:hypothetical protein
MSMDKYTPNWKKQKTFGRIMAVLFLIAIVGAVAKTWWGSEPVAPSAMMAAPQQAPAQESTENQNPVAELPPETTDSAAQAEPEEPQLRTSEASPEE